MNYRVIVSPTAAAEAQSALDDIAAISPSAAERWQQALVREVAALERMPRIHGFAREHAHVSFELRQVLVRPYRVLFRIVGETVSVMHVRHGSMDDMRPEELGR